MRNVLGAHGDVHRENHTKERIEDCSTHQTKLERTHTGNASGKQE